MKMQKHQCEVRRRSAPAREQELGTALRPNPRRAARAERSRSVPMPCPHGSQDSTDWISLRGVSFNVQRPGFNGLCCPSGFRVFGVFRGSPSASPKRRFTRHAFASFRPNPRPVPVPPRVLRGWRAPRFGFPGLSRTLSSIASGLLGANRTSSCQEKYLNFLPKPTPCASVRGLRSAVSGHRSFRAAASPWSRGPVGLWPCARSDFGIRIWPPLVSQKLETVKFGKVLVKFCHNPPASPQPRPTIA
jgi:hypothetical protein